MLFHFLKKKKEGIREVFIYQGNKDVIVSEFSTRKKEIFIVIFALLFFGDDQVSERERKREREIYSQRLTEARNWKQMYYNGQQML